MENILVIDDDKDLCEHLHSYLSPKGYSVEIVCNKKPVIDRAVNENYDLIVLNLALCEANGFDALRQIRNQVATPIIALTTGGNDVDRIVGLELGADDCLSKPFNSRELLARIRAVLRRIDPNSSNLYATNGSNKLQVGDVTMDLAARSVTRSGEKVDLTSAEFTLLEHFLENPGELVLRETLHERVLGRSLTPYDRSIDVHVSNLRKKLGNDIAGCERIKSIRGEGYLYAVSIVSTSASEFV